MRTLQQLHDDRIHASKSAAEIMDKAKGENRPLHADEQAAVDKLIAKINEIDAEKQQIVATQDRAEQLDALLKSGRQTKPDPLPQNRDHNPLTPAQNAYDRYYRVMAMKAFKTESAAYRAGMWCRANLFGDKVAAGWCERHGVNAEIYNAQGENTNTAGGFLVPEAMSQAIIDLRERYGVFRRYANVVPMGGDTIVIPRRAGGLTAYYVGENPSSAITESDASWNQVRLTAKKLATLTRMSNEVADDAIIDLADWLANEIAYAFALAEDQAGFNGDGTSTYGGIVGLLKQLGATAATYLGSSAQRAGAVDAASGHDTFAEIDNADITSAMGKLPEYARMGAAFFCSATCADAVFGRLQATAGGNTIQSLEGEIRRTYLGHPIVISQVFPTSTGDLSDLPMLLFGNLMLSSSLGSRRGVTVMPSEHRYFDTDQIGIRGTQRYDIVNHDVGDTTNAGPVVSLVGE